MSIHLRAIHDFPQDCNPHEADLLRRELAYYIYRRIGRTRITVHLEGYSPTVPYPQVQEFFARVFGDLIRLERLNPQRIHDRLRLTTRGSENATILKQEAKAALRIASTNWTAPPTGPPCFDTLPSSPTLAGTSITTIFCFPKRPASSNVVTNPTPRRMLPATPSAPRIKMNKPIGGHLATTSSWRQKPGRVFRVKVGGQFPPEPFCPLVNHTTPSEKTRHRQS